MGEGEDDGHWCVWARERMTGIGVYGRGRGCGIKTLEPHTQPQGAACGRVGSVQATGIEGSTRHCAYVGVRSHREVLDNFAAACWCVSQRQSLNVSTVTWPPLSGRRLALYTKRRPVLFTQDTL